MDDTKETRECLGEKQKWTVRRTGNRPLTFRGWRLGSGSQGSGGNGECESDWTRGMNVAIWLAESGRIVIGEHSWSRWQGEGESYRAHVYEATLEAASKDLETEYPVEGDAKYDRAAATALESAYHALGLDWAEAI